jgi:hypothetical protein
MRSAKRSSSADSPVQRAAAQVRAAAAPGGGGGGAGAGAGAGDGRELSCVLRQRPASYSARRGGSVRATWQRVARVDVARLHPRVLRVRNLLLCGNALASLEWAVAFPALERLSLADNLVETPEQVARLAVLPRLRHLSLRGCPVERRPFFRQHVRVLLPALESLDGRALPPAAEAVEAVRALGAMLALLTEDFCTAHSLATCLRIARLHAELCAVTVRYPSLSLDRRSARLASVRRSWQLSGRDVLDEAATAQATSANVGRLLQLWDYAGRLEVHELAAIHELLASAVVRSAAAMVHRQLPRSSRHAAERDLFAGWEWAAVAEVSRGLRRETAGLLVDLERQKAADASALERCPRMGPRSALRHLVELEAERALRYDEDQVRLVADLVGRVARLRADMHESPGRAAPGPAEPAAERSWGRDADLAPTPPRRSLYESARTSERLLRLKPARLS